MTKQPNRQTASHEAGPCGEAGTKWFCPCCGLATSGSCNCRAVGPLAGLPVPPRLRKRACAVCGDPTLPDKKGMPKVLCEDRSCWAEHARRMNNLEASLGKRRMRARNLSPEGMTIGDKVEVPGRDG